MFVPIMYPRVKRVRRGDQVHEYAQLVEGHRVDGKVRQRVVAMLGRLDELKASRQLDRWVGAFARLGRALEVFDTAADCCSPPWTASTSMRAGCT